MTSWWRTQTIDHSVVTPRPWPCILLMARLSRMNASVVCCLLHLLAFCCPTWIDPNNDGPTTTALLSKFCFSEDLLVPPAPRRWYCQRKVRPDCSEHVRSQRTWHCDTNVPLAIYLPPPASGTQVCSVEPRPRDGVTQGLGRWKVRQYRIYSALGILSSHTLVGTVLA